MSKQAIIITAYRDEENLIRLIRHFANEMFFRLFIHVDRRSTCINEHNIKALGIESLECIRTYPICWGSINHVHAILDLMKMALEDTSIRYCHVISGGDCALHSPEWYVQKFGNCGVSYCNITTIQGREDWYCRYRWPSRLTYLRGSTRLDTMMVRVQHWLGISRKTIGGIPLPRLAAGLVWGSFTREACEEFVRFREEHPRFVRALNYTSIPEEVYFATVVTEKGLPVSPKGNRRYSVWSNERGWPGLLDEKDFRADWVSENFFARKVDSRRSGRLLKLIDNCIAHEKGTGTSLVRQCTE